MWLLVVAGGGGGVLGVVVRVAVPSNPCAAYHFRCERVQRLLDGRLVAVRCGRVQRRRVAGKCCHDKEREIERANG